MTNVIPSLVAEVTRNRAHLLIPRSYAFSTATVAEEVVVTRSNSSHRSAVSSAPLLSSTTQLVDGLLDRTAKLVDMSASNNIAYSGGVDSSLSAALVHQIFTSNRQPAGETTKARVGMFEQFWDCHRRFPKSRLT